MRARLLPVLLLPLFLSACNAGPAASAAQARLPEPLPHSPMFSAGSAFSEEKAISISGAVGVSPEDWPWDESDDAYSGPVVRNLPGGDAIIFERDLGGSSGSVRREHHDGSVSWKHPLGPGADTAALRLHAGDLVVAEYAASGGPSEVVGLDPRTGALRWRSPLQSDPGESGPVRVQLRIEPRSGDENLRALVRAADRRSIVVYDGEGREVSRRDLEK